MTLTQVKTHLGNTSYWATRQGLGKRDEKKEEAEMDTRCVSRCTGGWW